jgi:GNAT superfamily N-acetyltransferase
MHEVSLGRIDLEALSTEVLGRGGTFCFQARGSSMLPFIRSGDLLAIQPVEAAMLQVGDVAFYWAAARGPTVHRVVSCEAGDGQAALFMRGDAHSGPGERVSPEQVLGRVVSVQRSDRVLHLDRSARRLAARLWVRTSPFAPRLLRLAIVARHGACRFLEYLQARGFYDVLARALIGRRASYRIAVADDALDLSRLYGSDGLFLPGERLEAMARQLDGEGGCRYTLVAVIGGRIVGATVLRRFPQEPGLYPDWWLFGMLVQARYRGAGIGEGLVRLALEKARSEGATTVNLLVFEDNRRAVGLYGKMGFRPGSIPGLEVRLEEDAQRAGRRRVIMSRPAESPLVPRDG